MTAREVESAACALACSRRRIRETAGLAGGCAIAALVTLPVAAALAVALGVGAITSGMFAVMHSLARRHRIAQLALDPQAHEVPEVSRYASRLTRHVERQRLAAWILEILREASRVPETWYLASRVLHHADELRALSCELADPRAEIQPTSAAAVHLLLTQAVESPLYNPALSDEALPAMIAKIRLGIRRSAA
jgi:hypothetical protein